MNKGHLLPSLLSNLRGKSLRANLIRGATGSIGLKITFTGLNLVLSILLARTLGATDYGIYVYAYALVTLMAVPAQLGLPTLVVREVAKSRAKQQWSLMRGLLLRTNQAVFFITLLLTTLSGTIAWWFRDQLTSVQLNTFAWALVLLPLIALGNLRGAALRGLQCVIRGQLPEHLLRPGLMVLFIGAIVFTDSQDLTPALAMALHALAAFMAFLVGATLLLRTLPKPVRAAKPAYNTRVWFVSALPLSFIAGMQVINGQTDIVMLGFFTTAEEVGIYRIAAHGAQLVAFTLGAINMVISPHIAHLYAVGDHKRLQQMLTWSARVILASALPVALAFVLFGESILGFLYGPDFTVGYWALVILCMGQLTNAAMGSVAFILNMTGHERDSAWGIGAAASVNALLNLALIPPLGIEGAAIATATSLAIWNIILARRVFKRTGLVSTAIGKIGREKPA